MHWCASCKVEYTKNVRPTVPIPCPARDRVINDCRPYEYEDQSGSKTPAFCYSTDCDHMATKEHSIWANVAVRMHIRDCSEHQLVDTENDRRHSGPPDRGFL